MNILITGGAGFIGSEIVNQLAIENQHNIYVLDCMTQQIHGADYTKSYLYQKIVDKCHFIKADVRDFESVKKAVEGMDVIIHLAAETGTGQSMYMINQYNEVNIMGTSNLFQAISVLGKESKVKKIILSSSRSVYGEGKYSCPKCGVVYPDGRNGEDMNKGDFTLHCPHCRAKLKLEYTSEDSEIKPFSLYAYTKYAQEKMVQTMCRAMNIDYTIFRFQNVYGVGQSLKNPYTGILSIFSTLMLENKDINIFEDGKESRDFIHVHDIAKAVLKSITEEKSNGRIINLGSGKGTSVMEIATMLKKNYSSSSKLNITGDYRIGDIAHNIADISVAKEVLGFEPEIELEDGLNAFCKWVLNQDTDNSGYEKSLSEMENAGMFVRKTK